MSNPIVVEVTRGGLVESRHRGALAIVDTDGAAVATFGDVARPVYPRSAVKALQALPLVESGAAEALDYDPAELALACSSHNGEAVHVSAARVMLIKAGLDERARWNAGRNGLSWRKTGQRSIWRARILRRSTITAPASMPVFWGSPG